MVKNLSFSFLQFFVVMGAQIILAVTGLVPMKLWVTKDPYLVCFLLWQS